SRRLHDPDHPWRVADERPGRARQHRLRSGQGLRTGPRGARNTANFGRSPRPASKYGCRPREISKSQTRQGQRGSAAIPYGAPPAIIDKLNAAFRESLAHAETRALLDKLGAEIKIGTPAEFKKMLADELAKWTAVVKAANIKVD